MIDLRRGDCLELMKEIPDDSVDAIVTDPPYEYLNHRLDKRFNEKDVFDQWNRVVKPDGMIVFFGRGESFHRWNYLLNNLGWKFKEEVIWEKNVSSTPFTAIGRNHETVSMLSRGGHVRKVKVPYFSEAQPDFKKIGQDLKRLSAALKNPAEFKNIEKYLETGQVTYDRSRTARHYITAGKNTKIPFVSLSTIQQVKEGTREKDVINVKFNRHHFVHPTQKPVELMQRLINLSSDKSNVILDPFMGSASTGVACVKTGRNFIGMEIDQEYFEVAQQRIRQAQEVNQHG